MIKHYEAEVLENKQIAKNTFLLTLAAHDDTIKFFRPGQFAHIKIPNSDAMLLRRPISINRLDVDRKQMQFAYLLMGKGTRRLSQIPPEERLDILAPMGQGFKIRENHKKIYMVGGGIGIAPLLSVADYYQDRSFTAFLGYKSADYAYQTKEFGALCDKVVITSDDGTIGAKGFVTDALKEELKREKPDLIISCGPPPMFRALKKVWKEVSPEVETQVSMEQHMGCGAGGCYTCTCMVAGSMKRVCMDGPVFDIREVEL